MGKRGDDMNGTEGCEKRKMVTPSSTSQQDQKRIEYPCGCRYLFDHHIKLERVCSEHELELIANHG